jgi:capsular polysaccharide biosynthesis protein
MTDEHFKVRTKRYASVFIRGLVVATAIFIATMALGIYITNQVLAKVYSATATIRVQGHNVAAEAYSGWAFSSPQSRAVEAELETLESPELLHSVISALALDKAWADRIFGQSDPLTTEQALRYLESHLRLTFKHDSNVVEITALSDDPREAAQIANNLAGLYKLSRDDRNNESASLSAPVAGQAVQILSRAEVPAEPSSPNKRFCYALSAAIAGMLSVMVASSLEICLLISRAEAATRDMLSS